MTPGCAGRYPYDLSPVRVTRFAPLPCTVYLVLSFSLILRRLGVALRIVMTRVYIVQTVDRACYTVQYDQSTIRYNPDSQPPSCIGGCQMIPHPPYLYPRCQVIPHPPYLYPRYQIIHKKTSQIPRDQMNQQKPSN